MKNKKIKFNSNNGITLIALVITIIILIILAGITISIALGENGILGRSKEGKEQYTIEAIRENLDEIKGSDYIEKIGDSTIDTYLETLDKEKIEPYNVTKKEKISDSVAIIEVDNKYSYIIKIDSKNEIKIEYEGKIEDIDRSLPVIEIDVKGETLQTEFPLKLSATVKSNGKNEEKVKWVLNTEASEIGTNEELYPQTGEEDIQIEIDEVNSYYIHTLTIDQYGRKQETIKGPITVVANKHVHTGSSSSGGGCYVQKTESYLPTNPWNNCDNTTNKGWVKEQNGENIYRYKCNDCGSEFTGSNGWHRCSASKHMSTRKYYVIGCGKTDTIENYTINY